MKFGQSIYYYQYQRSAYRGTCYETVDLRPFDENGKRREPEHRPIGFRPPEKKVEER